MRSQRLALEQCDPKNVVALTDLWLSTSQIVANVTEWLRREYPVFVGCRDKIHEMLTRGETSCDLPLLSEHYRLM